MGSYWNSLGGQPRRQQQIVRPMTGQPVNQSAGGMGGGFPQSRGIGPSANVAPSTGPGSTTTQPSSGGIAGVGAGGVTAGTSAGGYGTNIRRAPIGGSQQAVPSGMRAAKAKPEKQYTETDFQSAIQAGIAEAMKAYAPNNQANATTGNATQGTQPDYPQEDQGYSGGGNKFDAYGGFEDAVGHEGTAKSGMNRDAYRDAWMGSGIGDSAGMDAWLAQNGGQRLNDAGVVRTPFGEILDMGIGYKGGRGRAGWTNIGMNG